METIDIQKINKSNYLQKEYALHLMLWIFKAFNDIY